MVKHRKSTKNKKGGNLIDMAKGYLKRDDCPNGKNLLGFCKSAPAKPAPVEPASVEPTPVEPAPVEQDNK